jgi:uncharacterized protein YfaS (alpha-2-macroglobulin family)
LNAVAHLLARNNEILGEAVTDSDGRAVFQPGLIRGLAGLAPAALLAEGPEGDFVFLDLTRGGFDLSDRGVTGRPSPGGVDVMAWTERGIYRGGETVLPQRACARWRSEALADLPLTSFCSVQTVLRTGALFRTARRLAAMHWRIALPENAMQGAWRAALHMDPKRPADGRSDVSWSRTSNRTGSKSSLMRAEGVVVSPVQARKSRYRPLSLRRACRRAFRTEGEILLGAPDT